MGIVSVSHCWESMEHPDPWGSQLHTLLKQIDRPRFDGKSWAERYDELWVFIDFICLPQYPRTEEEQRHFKRAMGSMHVLYAHRAVHHVIRLEKLTSRDPKTVVSNRYQHLRQRVGQDGGAPRQQTETERYTVLPARLVHCGGAVDRYQKQGRRICAYEPVRLSSVCRARGEGPCRRLVSEIHTPLRCGACDAVARERMG